MTVAKKNHGLDIHALKAPHTLFKTALALVLMGVLLKSLFFSEARIRTDDIPIIRHLVDYLHQGDGAPEISPIIFAPLESNPEDANSFNKSAPFVFCAVYLLLAVYLLY